MKQTQITTPCYIIHQKELDEGIALLKKALEDHWSRSVMGYSFKTNALPWVLMHMRGAGFYAEVVSEDEYNLARYMGFEHMIYNGPVKSRNTFLDALRRGHIVNLDAERELDWLEESCLTDVCVGLRVNFDLEAVCPGETSSGTDGGRFGFSFETGALGRAMERLSAMGVKLSGLHLHASSKTRSVNIYRALARMAVRLIREYGLHLDYIDIGGGYFGGMDNRPKFPDYIQAIREELLAACTPEETTLIVEPGTSLITPPIEYLMSVVDCKDTHAGRFVVTNGSRSDVDPLHGKCSYFHKIWYGLTESGDECVLDETALRRIAEEDDGADDGSDVDAIDSDAGNTDRPSMERQVICGYTCMENDRLFALEEQPKLQRGDVIACRKTGGYTMCLTPLFIRYFPPVYVERDGIYTCVRERWGIEEFVRKNHF